MRSQKNFEFFKDQTNDFISKMESKAAVMISKIQKDESEARTIIRNAERNLLIRLKTEPQKWHRNFLQFHLKSTEPTMNIEVGKNFYEFQRSGPITPQNGWQNISQIDCYKNLQFEFEIKLNEEGANYMAIGNWFELYFQSEMTNGRLTIKHSNGLYKNTNRHSINHEPFPFLLQQWYKERS